METISKDVLGFILTLLTPVDIINLAKMSKSLETLCRTQVLTLLLKHYPRAHHTNRPWQQFLALTSGTKSDYVGALYEYSTIVHHPLQPKFVSRDCHMEGQILEVPGLPFAPGEVCWIVHRTPEFAGDTSNPITIFLTKDQALDFCISEYFVPSIKQLYWYDRYVTRANPMDFQAFQHQFVNPNGRGIPPEMIPLTEENCRLAMEKYQWLDNFHNWSIVRCYPLVM
ncbi:MAG: hypothetical protein ACMG6E_07475 [Candidatus Roizmanbacteria bacterium]